MSESGAGGARLGRRSDSIGSGGPYFGSFLSTYLCKERVFTSNLMMNVLVGTQLLLVETSYLYKYLHCACDGSLKEEAFGSGVLGPYAFSAKC